ncbi:MAG: hypothetical protein ACK4N5_24265, partial [Myxococcales bacterium]
LVNAVGMDVIPTDVVAALASEGLPDVLDLKIAIAVKGSLSRGTLRSAAGVVGSGGMAVVDGRRVREPALGEAWDAPFPPPLGTQRCLSLPLADLVTAPRTTGCRNLRVYGRLVPLPLPVARLTGHALRVLGAGPARAVIDRLAAVLPEGPGEEVRRTGGFTVVAEARSRGGTTRRAWMTGPEPYLFSGISAALCAKWAAEPSFDKVGALSPVQAFGAHRLRDALAAQGVTTGIA